MDRKKSELERIQHEYTDIRCKLAILYGRKAVLERELKMALQNNHGIGSIEVEYDEIKDVIRQLKQRRRKLQADYTKLLMNL